MKISNKFKVLSTIIPFVAASVAIPLSLVLTKPKSNSNNIYKSIWKLNEKNQDVYIFNVPYKNTISDFDCIKISDNNGTFIDFDKYLSQYDNNNQRLYLVMEPSFIPNNEYSVFVNSHKIATLNNDDLKQFTKYNLTDDQEYFFNYIKDLSHDTTPIIGLLRNASLMIQQAFYIALVNYYNNLSNPVNQSFWFAGNDVFKSNRFNSNVLETYGIINNSDFNFDPNSDQNLNIINIQNNYGNFDLLKSYITQILNSHNYHSFNLVFDEIEFINYLKNKNMKFFNFIFKYAKRILILSDGANHTNVTIPTLTTILNSFVPQSREYIIKKLNDYQNGKIKALNYDDVLNLIVLSNYIVDNPDSDFNYISFVNYDANVFNSISLNDINRFHDSAFSANFNDYSRLIDNSEYQNQYLNVYAKLFIDFDLSLDNVFINGIESFDPKKRMQYL